jgi:hypothetical protein
MSQSELDKCAKDFNYFFDNYVKISTNGLVENIEKITPFQKIIISATETSDKNIIEKYTRGSGATFVSVAKFLHMAMFNVNKTYIIFTTKLDALANIQHTIKLIHDRFPNWLKTIAIENANRDHYKFSTNSVIKFSLYKESALIFCRKIDYIYMDEPAMATGFNKDFWVALQNLANQTKCGQLIVSTEPTTVSLWDKLCKHAVTNKIDFTYSWEQ